MPASDVDRRARVADAAVSDAARAVFAAGRVARRRARLHAGAQGGGAGRAEEVPASGRSTRRRRWTATFMRPGIIGGANWGGAAFDRETAACCSSRRATSRRVVRIAPPDRSASNPRASEVDAEFVGAIGNAPTFTPPRPPARSPGAKVPSLPMFKPPYGELVAIDLDRGEIAWRVPVGDTPAIRNHPALQGRDAARAARRRRRARRDRHRRAAWCWSAAGHGSERVRQADGRAAGAGRAARAARQGRR